jgi:hypothetical protein
MSSVRKFGREADPSFHAVGEGSLGVKHIQVFMRMSMFANPSCEMFDGSVFVFFLKKERSLINSTPHTQHERQNAKSAGKGQNKRRKTVKTKTIHYTK